MINKELKISYQEYTNADQLDTEIIEQIDQTYKTAMKAHARYSGFHVGCLLTLENGIIIHGNNQESIAYPSGLCAERVALFGARANHPGIEVKRMVLTAIDCGEPVDDPVSPCGACRQIMVDIENGQDRPIEIWLVGKTRIQRLASASTLLPLEFKWKGPKNHR